MDIGFDYMGPACYAFTQVITIHIKEYPGSASSQNFYTSGIDNRTQSLGQTTADGDKIGGIKLLDFLEK